MTTTSKTKTISTTQMKLTKPGTRREETALPTEKTRLSKELKARCLAKKAEFDKKAARHHCIRCMAKKVVHRIDVHCNTKIGVLPHSYWLCEKCGRPLFAYISANVQEIRDAKPETERPQREAEMADRKSALQETLAENRAKVNADRAERGLPPIGEKPKTPRKPANPPRNPV
jgi:hypothetical protein